jgi:hypothetical protein
VNSYQYVNPYIAGSPVTGTEMFFGREDVFLFVERNLVGQHSNTPVGLYGQRRTGKTSVLYQLHRHLNPNYLCILVDLHGLSLDGMGNFLLGIANCISRDLRRDHGLSVKIPDRALFLADPRAAFETTFLEELWPILDGHNLLLMMDEVVRLQEEVRAGRLEREIFDYIRHLMQHHARLNFIFCLGSGLEEMEKDYVFLFSASLYHRISFLEEPAARNLIIKPAQGHYQVTPDAITRILQITSGHPYYTQLICHCMFDRWMRNPKPAMTEDDVGTVLAEAIELGSANLTYVWEDSSPEEQAVMAGMAAAMKMINGPVTGKDIREAWRDVSVSLPEREVSIAIHSLIAREVVAGERSYSFAVDLQRLWLDKHRRLDWVKEDLAQTLQEWDRSAEARSSTTVTAPSAAPRQSRFRRRPGGRTMIALAFAAAVVVALGAFAAVQLAGSAAAPASPRTSPSPSPKTPSHASAPPRRAASGSSSVAIGASAAHQPGAHQVAKFLTRYFKAINVRDYQAFSSLFAERIDTKEQFLAGYSSSTDSGASIVGLSPTAAGLAARVIFDSHQAPDISVTHTACTMWKITLYLKPHNAAYLIEPPPLNYKSSHRPCR